MKLFKLLVFSAMMVIGAPLFGEVLLSDDMHNSVVFQDVIGIDMDDVVSIRQKPGFMDFIGLVKIVFRHPRVLAAFMNIHAIQKEGHRVSQELNGSANVIHTVLEKLKGDGYGDFSDYADEILECATKPEPIKEMVDVIRDLKKQGYIIVGATNHDWKQELAYRKKMRHQGVDSNELFDAVVVTRVNHIPVPDSEQGAAFYRPVENENMYSVIQQNVYKPKDSYYQVLKQVASHIASKKGVIVKNIIFTDDKKENTDAAKKAAIESIHFDLSGGSARKTSAEDLQKTVANWKDQLKKYGIVVLGK
jgi:hypothetical protein